MGKAYDKTDAKPGRGELFGPRTMIHAVHKWPNRTATAFSRASHSTSTQLAATPPLLDTIGAKEAAIPISAAVRERR
jgi:hypothetical protein